MKQPKMATIECTAINDLWFEYYKVRGLRVEVEDRDNCSEAIEK